MATSTNPQSKAYPKTGSNTTRAKVVSNQGRTVEAKQGLKNVNVSRGPTVGNQDLQGKRNAFLAKKVEGGNLADSINSAYAARTSPPKVDPRLEGVESNVAPRRRSR